jgi:hypothetical protein
MGNFVNGCVILIMMAWFGMTGPTLDATKARDVISIQFAVGAAVSVFMVLWRWLKLKESEVRMAHTSSSSSSHWVCWGYASLLGASILGGAAGAAGAAASSADSKQLQGVDISCSQLTAPARKQKVGGSLHVVCQ